MQLSFQLRKGKVIMKKVFAWILCMILVVSLFAGCGMKKGDSDLAYVQEKGKLIVGITDYAPMDYKDENGQWHQYTHIYTHKDKT